MESQHHGVNPRAEAPLIFIEGICGPLFRPQKMEMGEGNLQGKQFIAKNLQVQKHFFS